MKTQRSLIERTRRLWAITGAFMRAHVIDEITYPASFVMTEIGVLAPLFIYHFVGELVGESVAVGGDYFTFAVIGMAVTAVLQAALGGFGNALQAAQNRGIFETFLVEPVPWLYLPVAMNLYRILLGMINGFLLIGVGLMFGVTINASGLFRFFILLVLGVIASVAVGVAAAAVGILAKRAQPLLTLYGLAASLLGGALFSVAQLPDFFRVLSYAIPHTYVINAARSVLMDDPGTFVMSFETATLSLSGFCLVALSLSLWLFHRALQYARREGILSGY
jgi:ABC-2 type transport system permease protein